jgi:lipoprotein-anchoring transpeptidase ErfK/SrfK
MPVRRRRENDQADKHPEPDQFIHIDRRERVLRFWEQPADDCDHELVYTFPIAVGAEGHKTNPGVYWIKNKDDTPEWTMPPEDWVPEELQGTTLAHDDPANPIKARWMGFNLVEGEGIHGTAADESIGTAASHGCIRMHVPDVIALFSHVHKGCLVYVT